MEGPLRVHGSGPFPDRKARLAEDRHLSPHGYPRPIPLAGTGVSPWNN